MCVTTRKYNNKISVYVAGYEVCALINTGSTVSVINSEMFQKMRQTMQVDMKSVTDNV